MVTRYDGESEKEQSREQESDRVEDAHFPSGIWAKESVNHVDKKMAEKLNE